MVSLKDLKFMPGCIVESIVTTHGADGPNAAPMGATLKNEGEVVLRPFTSTKTFRNLVATRCAVLNITDDPYLFYLAAFKDKVGFPKELFEAAEVVRAPRIKGCAAYVEVTVSEIKGGERATVLCRVERVSISKVVPAAYCRARFAVIESLVHATRAVEFKKAGRDVSDLLNMIRHYKELVSRVAPNSVYEEIMHSIAEIIGL